MGPSHAACKGPHLLLLPFVEQGHINPMLSLASRLATPNTFDCKVTFVNASGASAGSHPEISVSTEASINGSSYNATVQDLSAVVADDCMGDRLQFVTLNPSSASHKQFEHVSMSTRHTVFKQKLAALEAQEDLIEKIVLDSKASTHPISWVISDILLWKWVRKVADKHGLQLALLVPFNGLSLLQIYFWRIGKAAELEELLVTAFNLPGRDDARRVGLVNRDSPEVKMEKLKHFATLIDGIEHVRAPFLVNSFKQLEEPLLPLMEAAGVMMTFIGPIVGGGGDDIRMGNRRAQQAGSTLVQDEECMAWLERQERGSVLFVSFGSEGVLEAAHVEEISAGIHNSGYCFLWVVRPDLPDTNRPAESFRRLCSQQGRGMFVSWAPQRAVLRHAAVGGFLTHSGWNSTLESLSCGVPMLCLPLIGDQPLNANLVQSYWQVGLRLQQHAADRGEHVISRDDVERNVRAVMRGAFSRRVASFQLAAQQAVQEAQRNLTSILLDTP